MQEEDNMKQIDGLRDLLHRNNVVFEIIHNDNPIYSVNDAKGCYEIYQTAPVFIVKSDRGYFALILSGDRGRIDFDLVKTALQCNSVKLANKKDVFKVTSYEVGNVPLVGHNLPCILDTRLLRQPFVYGGVGNANYTLKIDPRDLDKINEIVARIN